MKSVFIVIVKSVAVLFILILVIGAYDYFNSRSIKNYCDDEAVGENYSEVNKSVRKKKFFTFEPATSETKRHLIANQRSPFFRMHCELNFEAGIVIKASYKTGD